jgi:hypothetical protein
LFGDWGTLKLVDKNGTALYGDDEFGDRIGNITEQLIYSIPEKLLGFDIGKWISDDTEAEDLMPEYE